MTNYFTKLADGCSPKAQAKTFVKDFVKTTKTTKTNYFGHFCERANDFIPQTLTQSDFVHVVGIESVRGQLCKGRQLAGAALLQHS